MIAWPVTESPVVLNEAAPPAIVPVPRMVVPSLNVTVPVAVEGVTEAVKMTLAEKVDGFNDDVTDVVLVA